MKASVNVKGILSVFAAVIHQSMLFSLFTFSTISIFLISYLRAHGHPEYTEMHGHLFSPINCLSMTIFCSINGTAEKILGPRLAILCGAILISLGSISLIFSVNLYLDFCIMILYGIGFGLGAMSATKNACMYFPKHEGVVTALCSAGGNLGATLYNLMAIKLITLGHITKQPDGYYSEKDAARYKIFLYFHVAGICLSTAIVLSSMRQFSEDYIKQIDDVRSIGKISDTEEASNPEKDSKKDSQKTQEENDVTVVPKVEDDKKETEEHKQIEDEKSDQHEEISFTFCDIVSNYRIWLNFAIFFLSTFGQNIITTTYMTFGLRKYKSNQLEIGVTLMNCMGCFIGPLWGLLYDKTGFRRALTCMNLCGGACCIVFYFSVRNLVAYNALGAWNGMISCGVYALLFPHLIKVFSYAHASNCYGIVIIATGSSNLLSALITVILKENALVYLIVYIIGASLSGLSLVVSMLESDKPFTKKAQEKVKLVQDKVV